MCLCLYDNKPLFLALDHRFIIDIYYDVLPMPFHDILELLAYEEGKGKQLSGVVSLTTSGYWFMIWIIKKHYDLFCTGEGDPVVADNWTSIMAEQYDTYCLSLAYATTSLPTPSLAALVVGCVW